MVLIKIKYKGWHKNFSNKDVLKIIIFELQKYKKEWKKKPVEFLIINYNNDSIIKIQQKKYCF